MKDTGLKAVLVYALLCMIWGSTWLVIRLSLESLTPLFSAGFRFLAASSLIYVIMRIRGIKLQRDRESIKLNILQGLFSFVIPFGLIYWAESYIPSGLAAVLFAVYPFVVALSAFLFIPGEQIGAYKISGIIAGFTGIVIIFWDDIGGDFSSYLLGMLATVFSASMQAVMAVVIKKKGHHLHPLSMNLIPMSMAGIFLLITASVTENFSRLNFDANAFATVLYLAIFGSIITFTGYYWLLKKINVVILSLMSFITPVVALFLGWIVVDEHISAFDLAGCIFVLGGLIIANLQGIRNIYIKKAVDEV